MIEAGKQDNIACRVLVEGRVTGVGFRWSALDIARGLPDLRGWIRNVGTGQVEAIVQGPREQVDTMLAWLRRGPAFARVTDIRINPEPVSGSLPQFTIR